MQKRGTKNKATASSSSSSSEPPTKRAATSAAVEEKKGVAEIGHYAEKGAPRVEVSREITFGRRDATQLLLLDVDGEYIPHTANATRFRQRYAKQFEEIERMLDPACRSRSSAQLYRTMCFDEDLQLYQLAPIHLGHRTSILLTSCIVPCLNC